jgi:hypothetical protein
MNLKAKLYILKNHTLLLLSPSPMEHWLESYLCFTEGSLPFSEFAFRSSIIFLGSSARTRDRRRRPLPELLQRCAARPRVTPLSSHRLCCLRCSPLALPRRTTGAERLPHTRGHAGAARRLELRP